MRRRGARATTAPAALVLALLVGLVLPPAGAQQESLGITPIRIDLQAIQGQTYLQQVSVQNQYDSTTEITIEHLGEAAAWTTTEPSRSFLVPAQTTQLVRVTIVVPADAAPGAHAGFLRFVAEPKGQPTGSGLALRAAVAVPLNLTLGGEELVRLRWLDARAEDVEAGTPPLVLAQVLNEGNVRALARVRVEVLGQAGDAVLLEAEAEGDTIPGQTADLPVRFERSLAEGSYRARVRSVLPPGFEKVVEFQVLPPGTLAKSGTLRALQHEPWVEAGLPVKVTGLFSNTGQAPIARAMLRGEALLDGRLMGVFESDELLVPVGEEARLTAFFTPPRPGQYRLAAKVVFDGLESQPNESLLNVQAPGGSGGGAGGFTLGSGLVGLGAVLVVGVLVAVGAFFLVARGRRRRGPRP